MVERILFASIDIPKHINAEELWVKKDRINTEWNPKYSYCRYTMVEKEGAKKKKKKERISLSVCLW